MHSANATAFTHVLTLIVKFGRPWPRFRMEAPELQVRDSASEELRRARGKMATIAGRLRGILKGHGGEPTEQACPSSALTA